jgi:RND family efflux transporter MFP subunit
LAVVVVAANRFGRGPNALAEAGTAPPPRNVRLTRPSPLEDAPLTLPANIEGFQCTLLYARVNGYVRTWLREIGDRVKQGQVLAEIDTPEMDQELEQARATLIQGRADLETAKAEWRESEFGLKQAEADVARAKANLEYSLGVHTRNTALRRQGVIPQQDFDDSHRDTVARQADIDSAEALRRTRDSNLVTRIAMIHSREAAVRGYEASVRRLEEMQAFKKIVAPFDGIVTRRRAEIGMLVAAGNPQTSQELFAVTQADRLRIKISVPQTYAPSIQAGRSAQVFTPEYPDRVFTATIARTARSIDPAARTLAVELELANPEYVLLPGEFARVCLATHRATPALTVPIHVLLSRIDGPHVAVVGSDSTVRLRKVQLGRDYGHTVEVLSGLRNDESVVLNPPDDLQDDEKVTVAAVP